VILESFKKLIGLPRVTVEDPTCILKTLQWYENGFDFADALHLASSHIVDKFATLDKKFLKKAKKLNIKVITLE
jgi:predicted nucleic acid-binding protein